MVAVRIENRAQLIYLLTEAAELEHEILCCYLFASFSLKEEENEGLTAEQVAKVHGWRRALAEIAVQEMLHLTTVCNLLTAVGGAPQLRHPNLPTSPRAYPPAFQLRLLPFNAETLDLFVRLEQPEHLARVEDYRESAVPLERLSAIFSSERNYETVGELYRGIEDGFKYLSQKLGEQRLFIGPPGAQTAEPYVSIPRLIPVHDLESALQAIGVIVEQGEGASEDVEDSHYRRFVRMREEFGEELAADPTFEPARPVLPNPHTVVPAGVPDEDVNIIDDPESAEVANLFDGCYELMVQILGRLFVHAEESEAQLMALADVAIGLMFDVIDPLGRLLTRMPAGPSHPGLAAGPGFRLSRSATIPPHVEAAAPLFRERLDELASYTQFLQLEPDSPFELIPVREALLKFADTLGASASA